MTIFVIAEPPTDAEIGKFLQDRLKIKLMLLAEESYDNETCMNYRIFTADNDTIILCEDLRQFEATYQCITKDPDDTVVYLGKIKKLDKYDIRKLSIERTDQKTLEAIAQLLSP